MIGDVLGKKKPFAEAKYKSKAYISRVCCDIIEDLLKQTYDEENPVTTASVKCSQSTQTDWHMHYNLTIKQRIIESLTRFPEITDTATPDGVRSRLVIEIESNESDEEVYEIIENDIETADYDSDGIDNFNDFNDSVSSTETNFDSLRKVHEVLDQISSSVRQFMRERLEQMERNIFRINNGAPPDIPNFQDIPLDVRMIAYLLAQGDNRNVEELLRTVHQNVVVNVNLSYYFKIMLVMLTFNTLLLFKWMVWDQLEIFP